MLTNNTKPKEICWVICDRNDLDDRYPFLMTVQYYENMIKAFMSIVRKKL